MKWIIFAFCITVVATAVITDAQIKSKSSDPLIASAKVAVVDTEAGKVQGFIHNAIYTYRGIPYAKAEQFMPPEKVAQWEGVRTALTYGYISPLVLPDKIDDVGEFLTPHR